MQICVYSLMNFIYLIVDFRLQFTYVRIYLIIHHIIIMTGTNDWNKIYNRIREERMFNTRNNARRWSVGFNSNQGLHWVCPRLISSFELIVDGFAYNATTVFDNWRVLHGRAAFTGKRRMCGGYSLSTFPWRIGNPVYWRLMLCSKPRRFYVPLSPSQKRPKRGPKQNIVRGWFEYIHHTSVGFYREGC